MYRIIGLCVLLIIYTFPMEFDNQYDLYEKYAGQFLLKSEAYLQVKLKEDIEVVAERQLTPMEALDLVQKKYAANFEKINIDADETSDQASDEYNGDAYYYKLPQAAYYLVYEGTGETEYEYIIHLYEFVLDEPETDTGHFVTYGWYKVNGLNGNIDAIEYQNCQALQSNF